MFVLMFAGFFIHGGALPDYGWKVLFIFLALLFGWSTVGLIIPSLLGLIAMGIAGAKTTVLASWTAGFGGNVICLIVLFSVLSKWLEDVGLVSAGMNWFMGRKAFQGKPWLFITAFFFMVYFLAFLTGTFPAIFIGWACVYDICATVGVEKRSPLMGFLVVNVTAIGAMGDYCKPWSAWGLTAISTYESTLPDMTLGFGPYLVWTTVVYFVAMLLMILCGKYLMKLDASPLEKGDFSQLAHQTGISKDQKFATIFMIVLIIMLFIPSYLPKGTLKTILNTQMGVVGITVAAVVVAGLFRHPDGTPVFDFKKIANMKAIPWDPIMLLTATVPLGAALKADEAGIMPILTAFVKTHLGGMNAFAFYCITAIFLGLLTQVAHNLVLLVAITPIFISVASTLGFNTELIVMIASVTLAASLGTPAASTRAGMVFGNSDYVTLGDCYKVGWLSSITMILACLVVGVPLGMLL
jgi:sodium-dependent dicarboxylate transporter 2/3/5